MTSSRVSKLTNELIVFVPELDWDPIYAQVLREGGTSQITVDSVKSMTTPFGTRALLVTLTVTRARAQTWDLKQYVHRTLSRQGWDGELEDILAPGRAKFYRV